jgi:hypothetical protein
MSRSGEVSLYVPTADRTQRVQFTRVGEERARVELVVGAMSIAVSVDLAELERTVAALRGAEAFVRLSERLASA